MGPTTVTPGDRVSRYVLTERIGSGLGTELFRAHDEVSGRVAAVRVVTDPAMAADAEFRAWFLTQPRALAALAQPHIVPVYAAGEDGGVLYTATRFVFGTHLAALLRPASAALAPARAASLVTQVAAALDAAHAVGLVHHRVTPGNILIGTFPGQPEHAYVSDFGLARRAFDFRTAHDKTPGDQALEEDPAIMGDPDYSAPEQVQGGPADGRADQYALGCLAFRMLAGAVPFGRPSPRATALAHLYHTMPRLAGLRPELPPAIDAALSRAVAKNPADRYPACAELARALREACQ